MSSMSKKKKSISPLSRYKLYSFNIFWTEICTKELIHKYRHHPGPFAVLIIKIHYPPWRATTEECSLNKRVEVNMWFEDTKQNEDINVDLKSDYIWSTGNVQTQSSLLRPFTMQNIWSTNGPCSCQ